MKGTRFVLAQYISDHWPDMGAKWPIPILGLNDQSKLQKKKNYVFLTRPYVY